MNAKTRLLRNIVSNWAGFAVQALTAFFLTPFILRSLGATAYGIWILATGLIGYYGVLDIGFRSGLTQFLTRYLSQGDYNRASRTASTGLVLLTGLAFILGLVGGGLAAASPRLFHLSGQTAREAQGAVAILTVGVAVQFCFFTHSAVLTALQRFDVANAIGITTRLLGAGAIYLTLKSGGSLVALSAVSAMSTVVDYGLRWYWAGRLLPQLRFRVSDVSLESAREFLGFGLWNALIAAGVRIISYTDALVIGLLLVPAAVTPFAVAAGLIGYFNDLVASVGYVFPPHFTDLDARGDQEGLRSHYLKATALLTLGALLSGLAAALLAEDFLRLWIGPSVLEGNSYGSAATIFSVLMVGAVATGAQRIGYQVLLARRQPKLLAELIISEALLNLFLSVALLRWVGILGVAVGTAVPAVLFAGLVHPWILSRQLNIGARAFLRTFHPAVTVPFVLGGIALVALDVSWPGRGLSGFLVRALLSGTICAAVVLLFWRRALVESLVLPPSLARLLRGRIPSIP